MDSMQVRLAPRCLVPALVLVGLPGCGGDDGGPTAVPDVTGSYDVNFTVTETGTQDSFSCSGTLNIAGQTENEFSGGFVLEPSDDCTGESGTFTGTVDANGTITFIGLFEGVLGLDDQPGCDIIGGDSTLRGTVTDQQLTASGTVELRCRVGLESVLQFELRMDVTGTRSEGADGPVNPSIAGDALK